MRGEKDLGSQEVCTKRCKRIFSNSLTLRQALTEIQKVELSMRISWTGINFQNIWLILITEGSPLWCEFKVIFFRFINILKQRVLNKRNGFPSRSYQAEVPSLTEEEIIAAKMYSFKKATLEVKRFLKPFQYKDVSQEINDILTYTGRILPV